MSSSGHKFMSNIATLSRALTRTRLVNVQEFEENISSDEHLRNIEERDTGANVR